MYPLFILYRHSDAYPVLNLCVPPVRRSTTELDSMRVDIINWHLFADINWHLPMCVLNLLRKFSCGPVDYRKTLISRVWNSLWDTVVLWNLLTVSRFSLRPGALFEQPICWPDHLVICLLSSLDFWIFNFFQFSRKVVSFMEIPVFRKCQLNFAFLLV